MDELFDGQKLKVFAKEMDHEVEGRDFVSVATLLASPREEIEGRDGMCRAELLEDAGDMERGEAEVEKREGFFCVGSPSPAAEKAANAVYLLKSRAACT